MRKPEKRTRENATAVWRAHFFERGGQAPPGGWKAYLRDGWSQGTGEWEVRYRLYTRSAAWRQRRSGAIRRAGGVCAICEQASDRLDVHHVTYARVGEERVEDLRVLCRSCHGVVHTFRRQPVIPLNEGQRRHLAARQQREEARALRDAAQRAAADAPPTPKVRRRPGGVKPA